MLVAAVALVDAEGIQALTMRRLAADLGVEAMSLYYHLPGKEALLDGLVESVIDQIDAAVSHLDATAIEETGVHGCGSGSWRRVKSCCVIRGRPG